jgi:SAM-dependent methyltransferase
MDAANLPLPDASVDVIVSNLGVNNFANAREVLDNCHRMAKPGARILLSSNLVGHMAEFYAVYRETLIELGQDDRLAVLDAHVKKRATVASMRQMLEQSGFVYADDVQGSFRMRFADGSAFLRHGFIRLGFVQAWASVVEPALQRVVFQRLESKLNTLAAEVGALSLSIPMACVEARNPHASVR